VPTPEWAAPLLALLPWPPLSTNSGPTLQAIDRVREKQAHSGSDRRAKDGYHSWNRESNRILGLRIGVSHASAQQLICYTTQGGYVPDGSGCTGIGDSC